MKSSSTVTAEDLAPTGRPPGAPMPGPGAQPASGHPTSKPTNPSVSLRPLPPAPAKVSAQWEEPVPLQSLIRMPFPLGRVPSTLASVVRTVTDFFEVPSDVPGTLALGALAIAGQKKFALQLWDGYVEPLSLWVLACADLSVRKSPPERRLLAPFRAYEEEHLQIRALAADRARDEADVLRSRRKHQLAELVDLEDAGARAVITAELNSIGLQLGALPDRDDELFPALLDDASPVAMLTAASQNRGRVAHASAEGAFFLDRVRRAQKDPAILDALLKGYSGDPLRYSRGGGGRRPIVLRAPAVTIVCACQPGVVDRMLQHDDLVDKGLTSRVLYSVPETSLGSRTWGPRKLDEVALTSWDRSVRALLDAPWTSDAHEPAPWMLRLSDDALLVLQKAAAHFEARLRPESGIPAALRGWLGKLTGTVARIAALLHLYTHAEEHPESLVRIPIAAGTMKASIELGMYFLRHAQIAVASATRSKACDDAQRLLQLIKNRRVLEFSFRDAHKMIDIPGPKIAPVLDQLVAHGFIRAVPRKPDAARNASQRYEVNPRILEAPSPVR